MSLRRLSPPLHLLRAFNAVARFGSVSRAAESLHLTQSAVSKQVQELERWVEVPLFEREHKRLMLTAGGQRYDAAVSALLLQLEAATLDLIGSGDGLGMVHVSALPTIAAQWLVPRLPRFQALHPQITLRFVPHAEGYDFTRTDLDCSILFGDGHWPGARCHYLIGREVVLITPPVALGQPRIRRPRDIAGRPLLQHVSVPQGWVHWCEHHGVQGVDPLLGPQFDQFHTLIRAVTVGMGIALVPRCLVEDEIQAGMVQAPELEPYRSAQGYWLCHREDRAESQALGAFRDWLLAQAEEAMPQPEGVSGA